MTTEEAVCWLTADEQRMWRAERRMHELLNTYLERNLSRCGGLSVADYHVLVPLSEHPDMMMRARDLGATVSWNRSRLSHQIRRMESRGLVEKQTCPTDGRGLMVKLTDTGLAAIRDAAPEHVDAVREGFLDLLNPEELDVMAQAYLRVIEVLEEKVGGDGS